jgi:hypothetical protein
VNRYDLTDLRVVAAWEADSPRAPWRPIVPIFDRGGSRRTIVWPTEVGPTWVWGHEEPAASLDAAIEEGRASSIGEPLRPWSHGALVRLVNGAFALVAQTELIRSRLSEIKARLDQALSLFESNADLTAVQDAFDGACLVYRFDLVASTLRAGAATRLRDRDPEWCSQCVGDLAYVVEVGADLVDVRQRLLWSTLSHAPLRERLFRQAREALDDHLLPAVELSAPVDPETHAAAVATAVWRREHPRSRLPLPHALLVQVLAGEPTAVATAQGELERMPGWPECFNVMAASWRLGGPAAVEYAAHAQIGDLRRVARSLYHLEQLDDAPAPRSARWRSFVQLTQGLADTRDSRPWRQGELAAAELRARLDLDGHPLPAVSAFAMTHGIHVGIAALSGGDIDGAASLPRNVPPCVFVDACAAGRQRLSSRFTMAHELGHLLLDRSRDQDDAWVCHTAAGEEGARGGDEEKRANAFAAYLLAPREAVLTHAATLPSLDSAEFVAMAIHLRDVFGLTATAAAEHLLNCHRDPGSTAPGRDRLPGDVRGRLREAAAGAEATGFPGDQDIDAPRVGGPVPRTRSGRFAELVRRWVAVGQLSPDRAAELLGVDRHHVSSWLASAD